MPRSFEVVSVNLSADKGTTKSPVEEGTVDRLGLRGDAHAGDWLRQVSLLGEESIRRFVEETGRPVRPGEFAENLTLRGADLAGVRVLDRFRIGEVELEVTQIGKACHGPSCAIFREVGRCVMPKEGIFTRVLRGGTVRAGDRGEIVPWTLRARVVTLSDRASRGEREDRSGPRARALLEEFLAARGWRAEIASAVLPDEREPLRAELLAARDAGVDLVLTTGGTGIGPRDVTPEVVEEVCEKRIPGIMDAVRLKHGAGNPRALLSRSVAGLAGGTLVFALPGSVRAVEEYLAEILPLLEHLLQMQRGLDTH